MATAGYDALHGLRKQIADNCCFFNGCGYVSVIVSHQPIGTYKAFAISERHRKRDPVLSSDGFNTVTKALEHLLTRSADGVEQYISTNGFGRLNNTNGPPNDDDDDDDLSSVSSYVDETDKDHLADSSLSLESELESAYESVSEDDHNDRDVRYVRARDVQTRSYDDAARRRRASSRSPRRAANEPFVLSCEGRQPRISVHNAPVHRRRAASPPRGAHHLHSTATGGNGNMPVGVRRLPTTFPGHVVESPPHVPPAPPMPPRQRGPPSNWPVKGFGSGQGPPQPPQNLGFGSGHTNGHAYAMQQYPPRPPGTMPMRSLATQYFPPHGPVPPMTMNGWTTAMGGQPPPVPQQLRQQQQQQQQQPPVKSIYHVSSSGPPGMQMPFPPAGGSGGGGGGGQQPPPPVLSSSASSQASSSSSSASSTPTLTSSPNTTPSGDLHTTPKATLPPPCFPPGQYAWPSDKIDYRLVIRTFSSSSSSSPSPPSPSSSLRDKQPEHRIIARTRPTRGSMQCVAVKHVLTNEAAFRREGLRLTTLDPLNLRATVTRAVFTVAAGREESYDLAAYPEDDFSKLCESMAGAAGEKKGMHGWPLFEVLVEEVPMSNMVMVA